MSAKFGSVRRLKSGRYQARYAYRGRRYAAPGTFKTQRLAHAWLAEEEELITFGQWLPPDQRHATTEAQQITVGEWLRVFHDDLRYRATPLKASTLQHYERVVTTRILSPLPPGDADPTIMGLASTLLVDLTKNTVYQWWAALNRAYPTPQTNQKAYKRLRAACAEAVERELIPANPVAVKAAGTRVKPAEKYLPTDEELQAIIEAMNPRYRAITSLVLFHGLRLGEAIALERRHVTVVGDVPLAPRIIITIEQNAQRLTEDGHTYMHWQTPKSEAGYRQVPIMASHTHYFLEHLRDYPARPYTVRSQWGEKEIELFTATSTGKPVMDTSYRSRLNTAEKVAGVTTAIDPHCGRNWLITRLAEQGAHLKEIGKLLGQTDLETITHVYMKVRAGRTDVLMDKVNATLLGE